MNEDGVIKYMTSLVGKLDKEKTMVLFGAGTGGLRFWDWAKSNLAGGTSRIRAFIDNNPRKWATVFPENGVSVVKPDDFLKHYNDELVVITCGEGDVIAEQLHGGAFAMTG